MRCIFHLLILLLALLQAGFCAALPAAQLVPVGSRIAAEVFVWTDTCNVYVLRDRNTALLINIGDGSVLDHLSEIGVTQVEWVLFTDHHREQTQGARRLAGTATKIAVPELERELFEQPAAFRKMNV